MDGPSRQKIPLSNFGRLVLLRPLSVRPDSTGTVSQRPSKVRSVAGCLSVVSCVARCRRCWPGQLSRHPGRSCRLWLPPAFDGWPRRVDLMSVPSTIAAVSVVTGPPGDLCLWSVWWFSVVVGPTAPISGIHHLCFVGTGVSPRLVPLAPEAFVQSAQSVRLFCVRCAWFFGPRLRARAPSLSLTRAMTVAVAVAVTVVVTIGKGGGWGAIGYVVFVMCGPPGRGSDRDRGLGPLAERSAVSCSLFVVLLAPAPGVIMDASGSLGGQHGRETESIWPCCTYSLFIVLLFIALVAVVDVGGLAVVRLCQDGCGGPGGWGGRAAVPGGVDRAGRAPVPEGAVAVFSVVPGRCPCLVHSAAGPGGRSAVLDGAGVARGGGGGYWLLLGAANG